MTTMPPAEFRCRCHSEEIRASVNEDGEVELAIWVAGNWSTPWSQRLRHIWRILRKGDPYRDHIILDPADAQRLAHWLLEKGADAEPPDAHLQMRLDELYCHLNHVRAHHDATRRQLVALDVIKDLRSLRPVLESYPESPLRQAMLDRFHLIDKDARSFFEKA